MWLRSMPCAFLRTPEELLAQHILVRLDLPTLRSCLLTCKRLNQIIESSALLKYSIKLKEMNLLDNPSVTYNEISLNKRLEMLRELRERRGVRSKVTGAGGPPGWQLGHLHSIRGDAGVLYLVPYHNIHIQELRWTTLPLKEDQAIEWNILRPSNPSAVVVGHALSIGENDLLAFATWDRAQDPFPTVQVYLIQHSTQLPYPGLSSAILDICSFQSLEEHDRPLVNLAIRGTNLAVAFGHSLQEITDLDATGHLSVWNWRTGEKRCEKSNTPDYHQELVFLREDILLHDSSNLSLELYHIPSSAGHGELPLIERLNLPRIRKELEDYSVVLKMSFTDNPTAVPSFAEPSNPVATKLFTADNLDSILPIGVRLTAPVCNFQYYLFVVHHHTLLCRADRALSRRDPAPRSVRWEEWGPDMTRMFWCMHRPSTRFLHAPCGSKLFIQRDDFIEVYDFGRAGRAGSEAHNPLPFFDEGKGQGGCFQDVVHTTLPFVYHSLWDSRSIYGNVSDWGKMYVDQSRIVGVETRNNERIDVVYTG